jgi:hypothetical protein
VLLKTSGKICFGISSLPTECCALQYFSTSSGDLPKKKFSFRIRRRRICSLISSTGVVHAPAARKERLLIDLLGNNDQNR